MTSEEYLRLRAESSIVIETRIPGAQPTVQTFPIVFPQSGLCADYDNDCFQMTQRSRVFCYRGDPALAYSEYVCPFLD